MAVHRDHQSIEEVDGDRVNIVATMHALYSRIDDACVMLLRRGYVISDMCLTSWVDGSHVLSCRDATVLHWRSDHNCLELPLPPHRPLTLQTVIEG